MGQITQNEASDFLGVSGFFDDAYNEYVKPVIFPNESAKEKADAGEGSTPTPPPPPPPPEEKKSNTLLYVGIGGAALLVGWLLLRKPKKKK